MPHLEQAVEATEIQLSAEDIAYLEEPYRPHPVLGHT
jgi:aryl-alcohol dehydrogenase-like predicted oxidoreductase